MRNNIKLSFEDDDYKCFVKEFIAVLKIKANAFYSLTNLDESRKLIYWFDAVEESEEIKAVLMLNEKGSFGTAAYEVFVTSVSGKDFTSKKVKELSDSDRADIRVKEVNVLNNFITIVINSKKLMISGLHGTIVTPFFGASLATNYRIASEDKVFSLIHHNYGLHAGGALPFFLPKYIGLGKATKYVINGGQIPAREAYDMGLINEILPDKEFDNHCIELAKKLFNYERKYLRWSKELLTTYKDDLINYLHQEVEYSEHY